MKMFLIALAATAVSVPALAQPTSPNGQVLTNTPEMKAGFANRGQCQAAFRQLRNEQRRSGERGGEPYNSQTNSEYNEASRTTTRCEEINGRHYVVFNAKGFD